MEYLLTKNYNKDALKVFIASLAIVIWLFASLFFVFKTVFSQSSVSVQKNEDRNYGIYSNKIKVGPATELLLQNIRKDGFNPVVVSNNKRDFFSVEGKMIALGKDNMTVFEYLDKETAMQEASLFDESSKTPQGAWKKKVHLYVDGNIIVFYMGERASVMSALGNVVGQFVAMNK